jgi:hypothetical protein
VTHCRTFYLLRMHLRALLASLFPTALVAPLLVAAPTGVASAQVVAPAPTYADLATLGESAPLAVRVKVRSQALVAAERAPGLAPGHGRLFIEADTLALIAGSAAVPEKLRYLVDVPLDAKGKPPKLRKQDFIVFARSVAGRPGELQLAGKHAQQPWSADLEQRLRVVLAAYANPEAPPRVTGVRDVLSSAGNLAGESETQIFLATANGAPAAVTVVRRPGQPPRWGVSWSELVDQAARPAEPGTLDWYRLACALPRSLPTGANLAEDAGDRARAAQDYRFVIEQLGPCARNLR